MNKKVNITLSQDDIGIICNALNQDSMRLAGLDKPENSVCAISRNAVISERLIKASYKVQCCPEESKDDIGMDTYPALIEAFTDAFFDTFGTIYRFGGSRDGKAAKAFIKAKTPIDEIIKVARAAWSNMKERHGFFCKQATTLHGLDQYWNQIIGEIAPSKSNFG